MREKMVNFGKWVAMLLAFLLFGAGCVWADEGAQTVYTDRDLVAATQIAYYHFTQEQLKQHGGNASVRELLEESDIYRRLQSDWNLTEDALEKRMAETAMKLYEEIVAPGSRYGDWRVADIRDLNQETGFYGILLDTGADCAVVAFRGSESTDTNQLIKDWMDADLGLLMDRDTLQQKVASEYISELAQKFSFGSYAVTGHSLGGNLAEHVAITAPDSIRGKLVQTVNFDGPGFSADYLERHKPEIEKAVSPITLYRWSLVGNLLTHPDCTKTRVVQVTEEIRPMEDVRSNYLRHSTAFLYFAGEWLQDGAEDLASIGMGAWSRKVDKEITTKRKELRRKQTAGK